ncbi:toxin C-terminal domain-containing protein, partial [Streptomyces sp. NPDC005500]|uniref:toxin C-terminal domain-containing protein n=1 Tax=Streptomyces sp. NPDC005500 TaxID=3155007 RepID=UPI00339FD613
PTGYEECADCPIWKQDDGGSGIATEEFEDMMDDADAFFENGDWGINPVNGDSPAAHRLETGLERYYAHAEAAAKKAQEEAQAVADTTAPWAESEPALTGTVEPAATDTPPSVECGPDGSWCSGVADEVTIVGASIVNDWGRTWCGVSARSCTSADQLAAEKWVVTLDEAMDAVVEQVILNVFDAYLAAAMGAVEAEALEANAVVLFAGAKKIPVANILSATRAELAAALGYEQRIPAQRAPFNSHGQEVYTNGKTYITPDVDGHNVANGWKMFNRKGKRMGTYDTELRYVKD